ncbi:MAG: superoxide dismutase [Leptolyngbyaceae cyanobacterium CSU_1_3]|nr:superoxide dismutase [Leptolyngbyaceae cyanobacterium CSU_1_3]
MRKLLQQLGFVVVGITLPFLLVIYQANAQTQTTPVLAPTGSALSANPAQLPPLPYAYNALEPYIDAQTMQLHHDKHHATYVNNVNDALKDYPDLRTQSMESLLQNLDKLPEKIRTKFRNNGGGHLNHSMYWQIMSPQGGGAPTGQLAQEITKTFGSFDRFKQQFNQAGADRFGSGWVWLVRRGEKLEILSTPNQDTPLMEGIYPIMGNDVWEHAYYLKYQNRRSEYLSNWWNVVNWSEIARRYDQAKAS